MKPSIAEGPIGARRLRHAGAGLAAIAMIALVPAQAEAESMYVHSARSADLADGRLTLHGVGRKVTWTTTNGDVGVARITRAHNRLFAPRTLATGTLHVAGQRGGEELAFRLSRPRYSAARRTASYRARPLTKRPAAAAAMADRRFGAASLSVVPHAQVGSGGNGGNVCEMLVQNEGVRLYDLNLVSSSQWDTDNWATGEDPPSVLSSNSGALIASEGGLWRGCSMEVVYQQPAGPSNPEVTFTINVSWPWTQGPSTSCTVSNPAQFACERADQSGTIGWNLRAY